MVLVGVHMVNGIGLLLGPVSTTVLIRTGMLLGKGTILDIGLESSRGIFFLTSTRSLA
jgi:hypothetical protein